MTRKTKVLGACLATIVALVGAAPWLLPLSSFVPQIEARAAERLGQPVKIAAARGQLLPVPRIALTGIVVGRTPTLKVGRLTITPQLSTLFSDIKIVRTVKLEQVSATEDFLRGLPGLVRPAADGPTVRVRRIVIEQAQLELAAATLVELRGSIQLATDGSLEEIRVQHQRDRLLVVARPQGQGLRLDIFGRNWALPAGPAVRFDKLRATALLTSSGISTRSVSAQLYEGTLTGPLSVSWQQGWSVRGALRVHRVQVQPLAHLLFAQGGLSGRLSAQSRFALRAHAPAELLPTLNLESIFLVEEGVLERINLEAAARDLLSKDAAKHGSTSFDQLTGRLVVTGQSYDVSELNVKSGLLAASGEVSVRPDRSLNGRIDVAVKGTGPLLSIPLKIRGTVADPSVLPSSSAVAGAIAGSVLLPGIGTALGLKAGQLGERLFGGGGRRKKAQSKPAPPPSRR